MTVNRRSEDASPTRQSWRRARVIPKDLVFLCVFLVAAPGFTWATSRSGGKADGRWAILIAGIGGDKELQHEFIREVSDLNALLSQQMQYSEDHIQILVDDPTEAPELPAQKATGENLLNACRRTAARTTRDDTVFVFIAGHGSYDGKTYKLNLVGPDPTADDLALALDVIPARSVIVVNTTTCSGGSIGALAKPGRVVVAATRSGQEKNRTQFGRYFVEALKNGSADSDRNGRVSVLEAFNYASQKVEAYYASEGLLQTEHPVLQDGTEGLLARTAYLDSAETSVEGPTLSAEERRLKTESDELERQIDSLKRAKAGISADEYEMRLENLLLRLAEINARLRQNSPQPPNQ